MMYDSTNIFLDGNEGVTGKGSNLDGMLKDTTPDTPASGKFKFLRSNVIAVGPETGMHRAGGSSPGGGTLYAPTSVQLNQGRPVRSNAIPTNMGRGGWNLPIEMRLVEAVAYNSVDDTDAERGNIQIECFAVDATLPDAFFSHVQTGVTNKGHFANTSVSADSTINTLTSFQSVFKQEIPTGAPAGWLGNIIRLPIVDSMRFIFFEVSRINSSSNLALEGGRVWIAIPSGEGTDTWNFN